MCRLVSREQAAIGVQMQEWDFFFLEYGEKLIVFPHAIEELSKFQGEECPCFLLAAGSGRLS